jgi:hypothetical protein
MTYLYDLILNSAHSALTIFDSEKGTMPPGHNGPYYDEETPVRNTSHWLITFLKAYKISGDKKFLNAAHSAVTYLCSSEARPMRFTFWHRKNPKKDTCNGLIGQAWTIEALVTAAIELEMPELINIAEEVFLMHPFEEKAGLWSCVSADGTYLDFDFTFNHQLWFAAIGSLLAHQTKGEVESQVSNFIKQLENNFTVHSSGLINHFVAIKLFDWQTKFNRQIKEPLFKIKRLPKFFHDKQYLVKKEIGYHSFNMYAFAILKQKYPDIDFWESKTFKAALKYINLPAYSQELEDNKYGFPYNPPGIEASFTLQVFCPGKEAKQEEWITKQFHNNYDFDVNMMCKNTKDTLTYAARLYESTRLINLKISNKI